MITLIYLSAITFGCVNDDHEGWTAYHKPDTRDYDHEISPWTPRVKEVIRHKVTLPSAAALCHYTRPHILVYTNHTSYQQSYEISLSHHLAPFHSHFLLLFLNFWNHLVYSMPYSNLCGFLWLSVVEVDPTPQSVARNDGHLFSSDLLHP